MQIGVFRTEFYGMLLDKNVTIKNIFMDSGYNLFFPEIVVYRSHLTRKD